MPVPLDRTFTYGVRDGQKPQRGARVIVPFRNEKLIGIVTAMNSPAPVNFEVRFLEAVLDENGEPLLSEHLMKLGEWIAQYYLAPLGEVLRGMLPLMAEVRALRIWGGMCWRRAWMGIPRHPALAKLGRATPFRSARSRFLAKRTMSCARCWRNWRVESR